MLTSKFLRCLILSAFVLSFFVTHAQLNKTVNRYSVEHFGEEEGLPNSIYSILPDKDGFLWIATSNGVVRFNGNQPLPISIKGTVYKNNFNNLGTLHYSGTDTILAYSSFLEKFAIISKNKIIGIKTPLIEKDGLFFSNQQYPVPAPAYINGDIYTSAFGKNQNWNISPNSFSLVGGIYDKDIIWIILNDGIGFYDKKGPVNKIIIPEIDITQVVSIGNQIIYLDKNNYLNYYNLRGLQKSEPIGIAVKNNLSILNNRSGKGFYCIADSCLFKVDISKSGKSIFRKLVSNLQYPSRISVVFEKDSNTIVTGTFEKGLYIYKKIFFEASDYLPNGLPNAFFAQLLLPDGKTVFAGKGYLFENGLYYKKKLNGFDKKNYGLLKDHKGRYWYGIKEYILRTNELGAMADTIQHIHGEYPEILLEDKDGRIWFSSETEFGYIQNEKYTQVDTKPFINRLVNCMKQDATGKYFIGTDSGLFVWDNIQSGIKKISGLSSIHIRDILLEPDGLIWVFTYGNGFFLIDKGSVFPISDNNTDLAFVHTLIEDEKGYCWLPSNNGLFVAQKQALLNYTKDRTRPPFFYMYSMKDGLRTNEFNGGTEPPYLRLSNGYISLASMDGLVHFSPSKMFFSLSASPIITDQIRLDKIEIEEKEGFNVGNDVNNINFSISTSYWGNPVNYVLEYQVTGENETNNQWTQIGRSGKINLFSPGHGNYQLIIRKRTGLATDEYLYKPINFYVLPKWYQTKLFLFAIVLSIAGLMTAIILWRRRYYVHANRILQKKINAATAELVEINNTLEEKVAERTLAIQQAELKFRTLVESSMVGVYIVQDLKFIYVNPMVEEMLGYNSGELTGTDVSLTIDSDQREPVMQKTRSHISVAGEMEHYIVIGLKKDGTTCLLESFGCSLIYEGKPTIIGTTIDITEKRKMEKQLKEQELQEQKKVIRAILTGEERERNTIAKELHDNINQILAGTKLYLSIAKRSIEKRDVIIADSIGFLDRAIEEIRTISKEKVTPSQKEPLNISLQSLIETSSKYSNIETKLSFTGTEFPIEEELKLNIYRIAQEQLSNILKHAGAKNTNINVVVDTKGISMSIADDGKGFDPKMKRDGVGISNMINRVESFNGRFSIKSNPGKGCKIDIYVPINEAG